MQTHFNSRAKILNYRIDMVQLSSKKKKKKKKKESRKGIIRNETGKNEGMLDIEAPLRRAKKKKKKRERERNQNYSKVGILANILYIYI